MTQYVRAINIANNSIKSFVFDSSVANTFNAASVASAVAISANGAAQAVNTFVTLQTQLIANTPPTINVISITDSSYNVLDDTAANTTGAYLQITGSNFQAGAIVMVGSSNTALTTTLVNSNTLRAQIPAISSGTYPVYVVNTNGGTGIRVNGLTTSSFPAWSTGATLSNQVNGTAFNVSLSASSDSNIIYANTTALPAGTTLAANGLFSGAVSVGANTTYNFTVKATDVELQDASRTFSVTVIVIPITPGVPGQLYSWGRGTGGLMGNNSTANRLSPAQVGADTTWSLISVGGYGTMATKTNGTLWAWGDSYVGHLGLNDQAKRSSPTQVGALTNWSKVSVGDYGPILLTKTDGTLWTIGDNNGGAAGLNVSLTYRSSPVQVGASTTWSQVSSSSLVSMATKTDGTLWVWGNNFYGGQGLNDRVNRSSPTQLGVATNWSRITTHKSGLVLATKTDGTLWAWGRNFAGQLGRNDTVTRSSPVQVGTNTNWSQISTGESGAWATKTDGTLWAWGRNDQGQLGQNNRVYRSSPTQVGVATNWSQLSQNVYLTAMATKTDGTLWLWGWNNYGQIGLNDTVPRSSPTQVGASTTWSQVSSSHTYGTSMAIRT